MYFRNFGHTETIFFKFYSILDVILLISLFGENETLKISLVDIRYLKFILNSKEAVGKTVIACEVFHFLYIRESTIFQENSSKLLQAPENEFVYSPAEYVWIQKGKLIH